jgi:hypothetical protein
MLALFACGALAACQTNDRRGAALPQPSAVAFATPQSATQPVSPSAPITPSPQRQSRNTTKGTLLVQVRLLIGRGGQPAPDYTPPPQPTLPPIGARVAVRLVRPSAPTRIVMERLTDEHGQARFAPAPGRYWVYVPMSDQIAGQQGSTAVARFLPDGELVVDWSEVTVSSADASETTLIAAFNRP